jgi:hypothetical protein
MYGELVQGSSSSIVIDYRDLAVVDIKNFEMDDYAFPGRVNLTPGVGIPAAPSISKGAQNTYPMHRSFSLDGSYD